MNIMNSAFFIFVVSWSVTQCPHVFRTFGMWIPHPIRSDFGEGYGNNFRESNGCLLRELGEGFK